MAPSGFSHLKVQTAVYHLLLGVQSFFHAVHYMLVRLVLDESQRVYLVTCHRRKFVDLFINVFRQVLAARVENVLFVPEDVLEAGTRYVVAELSLGPLFHGINYMCSIEKGLKLSDIHSLALTENYVESHKLLPLSIRLSRLSVHSCSDLQGFQLFDLVRFLTDSFHLLFNSLSWGAIERIR